MREYKKKLMFKFVQNGKISNPLEIDYLITSNFFDKKFMDDSILLSNLGFTDRNDVEIYEGDILNIFIEGVFSHISVVEYCTVHNFLQSYASEELNYYYNINVGDNYDMRLSIVDIGFGTDLNNYEIGQDDVEIIGNVYSKKYRDLFEKIKKMGGE